MAKQSFAFTKWYVDCVDAQGRLVIVYWASLEWKRIRLMWHAIYRCMPGERNRAKSSLLPCAPPSRASDAIHWKSSRIDCALELTGATPAIAPQELAPGVRWTCVAPSAQVAVTHGKTTYRGTGYAEVIHITVPPWEVGIDRLRWGRWISADATRSLVWIEWNGASEQRWVFADGQRAPSASVYDRAVTAGADALTLEDSRVALDRSLSHLVQRFAPLRAVAPRWLVGGREVRRVSRGTLRHGRSALDGSVVDEVVEFG